MTDQKKAPHFQGKSVYDHLKEARQKGAKATSETHGLEPPGSISAGADSAKETSFLLVVFWCLLATFHIPETQILWILSIFFLGWFFWKIGRSARQGWARLERLHRLIQQEHWEITHHRLQEKEELTEMYRQKGLSGKLLDDVIEILMADDNRLLRVMLEEELGLTLETFEHPLQQGLGAGIGVLLAFAFGAFGLIFGRSIGLVLMASLCFSIVTVWSSKLEGNALLKSLVWSLSIALLAAFGMYFMTKLFYPLF